MARGPYYDKGRYWAKLVQQKLGEAKTGNPQVVLTVEIQGKIDGFNPSESRYLSRKSWLVAREGRGIASAQARALACSDNIVREPFRLSSHGEVRPFVSGETEHVHGHHKGAYPSLHRPKSVHR